MKRVLTFLTAGTAVAGALVGAPAVAAPGSAAACDHPAQVLDLRDWKVQLPIGDEEHLVVGQIHGGDDDISVFRVEGTKLYATNGDDAHHRLVTDDFRLNTRFQVRFVVSGGKIHAYYNGALATPARATRATTASRSSTT